MAAFSQYLGAALVNHIFKATSYTAPTVIAIALFTADPTAAYITANEVANSNAYTRETLNPSSGSNWTVNGSNTSQVWNTTDIVFPTATGSGWGTITYVGLLDSATYGAGNLLFSGPLTASKAIGLGDIFKFLATDLVVTLS